MQRTRAGHKTKMGSGEAGVTLESPERKRGNARIRKEREGERKGRRRANVFDSSID